MTTPSPTRSIGVGVQFQNDLQTSKQRIKYILFMMNNVCFLGPFLQLNVGSVEKETEPADYNPNSTRSEKVRFMDSDQVNDNKIINDGMLCPLWMP